MCSDSRTGLPSRLCTAITAFLVVTFATAGLPGLSGFVGEFMTLFGAWQQAPWEAVVAAVGLVLGPLYMLRAFQGAVYAPPGQDPPPGHPPDSYLAPARLPDLTWSEAWVMVPLIGLMFLIGLFPVILTHAMTTLGLALHFPWS